MATTAINVDFLAIQAKCKTLLEAGFTSSTWVHSTAYKLNDVVKPTGVATGHSYRCTVAGTSHTVEPTWPLTFRGTVVDGGTLTWTEEEPITVSYLRPSSCTFPRILVNDIEIVAEIQVALGNVPSNTLKLPLDIICWINGTTKTWEQMRQQSFDVLKQVQSVIRNYPTLDAYAGAEGMQATSGVYTLKEVNNYIYHIQVLWMLKFIVKKT